MYENLEQPESNFSKIKRSLYLIISISLLTHTLSITYSIMSFKEESAGFISIIISSVVCFLFSSSHLTIYGISILGVLFLTMLEPYYTRPELYCIVAMSGLIIFPSWKMIHSFGSVFNGLPGRIHASMVFGIALMALVKFFPLSIENLPAFFLAANENALTSPIEIIKMTFAEFNVITLGITIACILTLFLLREKLNQIPFIAFFIIVGIIINWKGTFLSFKDLCAYEGVDCKFYIIKIENIIQPTLEQIIMLLPAAVVMTLVVVFEQFLYLEEFERRGKRFKSDGDLGNVRSETRILGLANIICGCLGGLPICINMFATYENFSFNMRAGYKGTKLVGLMQIPVSYALYSVLSWFYNRVPLFILFIVIATPAIYFLRNMLKVHYKNTIFITVLAALNVLTHPILALILAAFISINDISELMKGIPAEILLENINTIEGQRKSSRISQAPQKQQDKIISQFESRVIEIDDDKPSSLQDSAYVLYRFTGSISYLNYFGHIKEIRVLLKKYIQPQNIPLLLSFRYSQVIDDESLEELSQFTEHLTEEGVRVIFTGLHHDMMAKMDNIEFFRQMLMKDDRCMYCLYQ